MKTALLIGATSAIAQSLADQLAKEGVSLFLAGRSEKKLELIAADLTLRHGIKVEIAAIDFDDFTRHRQVAVAALFSAVQWYVPLSADEVSLISSSLRVSPLLSSSWRKTRGFARLF